MKSLALWYNRIIFFSCILSSSLLFSWDENQLFRRIENHLIIHDYASAKEEAKNALQKYPNSVVIHESMIKTLACLGQEREMMKIWKIYSDKFPEKKKNRDLIEQMCWGIIKKASNSQSLHTRLMALLGSFFGQDSRGVAILAKGMNDPNALIRAASVELAGSLHDTRLVNEMKRLYHEEKNWAVRQYVLKAIGKMKLKELSNELLALIASDQSSAEEKALAIKSLVKLLDELRRNEILQLAQSNRAGLRLLACQAISHFRLDRDVDQLINLANDNHPEVRTAALQALGLVRPSQNKDIMELARKRVRDFDYKAAISAAWLLTIYSPTDGKEAFMPFLSNENQEIRLFAAAALNGTGRYGVNLSAQVLKRHPDPYVCLNLAMGVITQQQAKNEAAKIIYDVLDSRKDKWVSIEEGIFSYIAPRNITKIETESDSTPEMENQIVRLEVLNFLAMVDSAKAEESIRQFLLERTWGISGTAAALLLMEGNDAAIELIEQLLNDENDKVRVQAALVLSLWSREEKPIEILEKSYPAADKDLKAKIIEGLARIGSMRSVPFLLEVLNDPSQYLRIIAATALIQCLNH